MSYQVHLPLGWRDALTTEHGWVVRLGGSLGLLIPPAAMAERLRVGTARVVADPEPPSIAVDDPVVAEMFACSGIDYTRTRA